MKQTNSISSTRCDEGILNAHNGGLRVRTNLRAGLAWDDLDDQAKSLWDSLTGAISNAVSAVTGSTTGTTTS
jgi:hypothetical protein